MSTLLTNIGELLTNQEPDLIRDAAVILDGPTIAWVGHRQDAPEADTLVDLGGRAVIPGFVDSHSHLVFAGDRSLEFEARMAGRP